MKTATITEAKNNLSGLIQAVRRGETFIVTDRSRPVAKIEPVSMAAVSQSQQRLKLLERDGIASGGRGGSLKDLIDTPPPRPRNKASALEALDSERSAGR